MFWRLSLTYGLLVSVVAVLLGSYILYRAEQQDRVQLVQALEREAALVRALVMSNPRSTAEPVGRQLETLYHPTNRWIVLHGLDGSLVPLGGGTPPPLELAPLRVTLPVEPAGNGPVAQVTVALPPDQFAAHHVEMRRLVWTAIALTALMAVVPALVLVRWITSPLDELTAGVRRLAEGSLGHKVIATGGGEVKALARTFNEMSERIAHQFAQLEADREQLHTILGGMIEGVIAIDADQRLLFANDRAGQLLGFSLRTAKNRKLWEVVRQSSVQQITERALAGVGPLREEIDWNGPQARSLTLYVARLTGPLTSGAILVLHDTTELRRLERLRRDFVANVSHELKTPLSVIKVVVETLLDGAIDDLNNRVRFLEQIDKQAEQLQALILDLLALARIESGAEILEFQAVGVEQATTDCFARQRTKADARRVTLEGTAIGPQPAQPLAIWGDDEAVSTILDNLVDNAIKYSREGTTVRVSWAGDGANLTLCVRDEGIGIPERDVPRIFERFYRVDKARSRDLGGTGLGLAIVKHLAQVMNGTVAATSQLGIGTTFTVVLPQASDG